MSKVQQYFKSKVSGKRRRKYGRLTLQQKIEIIKGAELGYSQRALASQYNCGKTQIHLLVTQKQMWLDKWEKSKGGRPSAGLRSRSDESNPFSSINELVFDFYSKLSAAGVSVTGTMLQERAAQVAKELLESDFSADSDWLETFSAYHGVELTEDSDDTGLTLLRSFESSGKDSSFIEQYDLCDIYNLGEVRLPYKFVPNDDSTVKPLSNKDYLTVSLCFNAIGAKEAEVVVYDSLQHGEVQQELYSQCVSNWKGIMTQSLYEKRLLKLNSDMARQNRQVLLLVDESKYAGSLECTMSNVKVKSTSACLQSPPLFCGIGHMFKFLYCRRLLRMLSAHVSSEENIDEIAEKITLNKAVRLIQTAWDDVQPMTIQSSFYEAGLKLCKPDTDDNNSLSESDESLLLEIKRLVSLIRKQNIIEDLPDDYFSSLLNDDVCSNSTSDCSDSEEEDDSERSLLRKSNVNPPKDSEKQYTHLQDADNLDNTEINSVISDVLPTISKLDFVASVLCNQTQLHRARMLLNDLEDLFENVITDFKCKSALESSNL